MQNCAKPHLARVGALQSDVLDDLKTCIDVLDDMDGVLDDVLYYIREGGRPCSKSSTISLGGVREGWGS